LAIDPMRGSTPEPFIVSPKRSTTFVGAAHHR
jgi:hypothetical protein